MPVEPRTPPHTYIPGKTARHPDGWFDDIRATASPEQSEAELATCDAFRAGLSYLRDGYYWEAHEVLEPVWMACPAGSSARSFVQALIQLANARLKRLMDRPKAARRLYDIAAAHLDSIAATQTLGEDTETWRAMLVKEKMRYNAKNGNI